MHHKVQFSRPDITDAEIDAVTECMKSGWLTSGPKVKEFEEKFVDYFQGKSPETTQLNAIAVNSATSGLVLALSALGIGAGDEVITTPYTFTATAEAIERVGATPVLVDIVRGGYEIDIEKVWNAINERTRAIVPVHFAGHACDMDSLMKTARDKNLKVIEDAAHALPTLTDFNRLVGTLDTDATVFSFYATKPLCTGEGGLVLTQHKKVAETLRMKRIHGIDKDAFSRNGTHYDVAIAGDKCNMTDTAAAMGIVQLQRLDAMTERRCQIARHYNAELGSFVKVPGFFVDQCSWHLYPIQLSGLWERGQFLMKMSEKGIQCGVHYIPIHLHSYWANKYGFRPNDFPNAFNAYRSEVSLPIYSAMTNEDVDRVVDAVKSAVLELSALHRRGA